MIRPADLATATVLDHILDRLITGASDPVSLRLTALAIREYGQPAIDLALERRARHRARTDATARKWQHSVSRRMVRGNHHDSWIAREGYVRSVYHLQLPAGLSQHASAVWRAANPDGRGPSKYIARMKRAQQARRAAA